MTRTLHLIRHGRTEMVEGVRASTWHLSAQGRRETRAFCASLDIGTADKLYSSSEPKATETAEIIAESLGLSVVVDERLVEQRRGPVDDAADSASFRTQIERVLRDPTSSGIGEETGQQALDRFVAALADFARREAGRDVAVVSHGTVIALAAAADPEDRVRLWAGLAMPDAITRRLP